MMRTLMRSALILLSMQVLAPLVPVAVANLIRVGNGHGLEPVADNFVVYGLVLAILMAASLAIGAYHVRKGPNGSEPIEDTFRYAGVAAAGSATIMVAVDLADDYFSGSGVGLAYPAIGFVMGGMFGMAFRLIGGLTDPVPRR